MLTPVVAHAGSTWEAWFGEPSAAAAILVTLLVYVRGRRLSARRWKRDAAFLGGLGAVAISLASPLDHVSSELASAHMAQHLLLIAVGAPLIVVAHPFPVLARGAPAMLHLMAWARQRLGLTHRRTRALLRPAAIVVVQVVVLWAWHTPSAYDAAVRHPWIHASEHVSFLGTAVVLWRVIAAPAIAAGARVLILFALAMQGVVLAMLLVFSPTAWYSAYRNTTDAWGLTRIEDQQLAGALMWVPGGAIYVVAALLVVARSLRDVDRRERVRSGVVTDGPSA